MSTDIQKILNDRNEEYGDFRRQSILSQALKAEIERRMRDSNFLFDFDQREALDMICHKIARIVNGNPNHVDSWHDIAGYALLVAERLEKKDEVVGSLCPQPIALTQPEESAET